MSVNNNEPKKAKGLVRFLNGVERIGNKMMDPLTLFALITLSIAVISAIFAGASAINPADGSAITIESMLTMENITWMLSNFTKNVNNFPALVLVLTIMFGVGLFESTGFAKTILKSSVLKAPEKLIVPILLFISINSNIAGDAGFVLMPMIGAMVFSALGKNPIAGMALCYAGVAGGFSANVIVGTTDALIIGFTQPAAEMIDPTYQTSMMMNYFFITASAVFLVPVGTFINNRYVEKRLGEYKGEFEAVEAITPEEKRGVRWAGIGFLVTVGLLLALCLPANSPMRDPKTGSLLDFGGGFINAIVPIIALVFFVPSVCYGFGAKVFRNDKDVAAHIAKAMASMASYVAFCIIAAQMIAYFNKSKMGTYVAVVGANFLRNIGLTGIPLMILFILLCAMVNLLIASNSAKWAILAPVFIPMFMLLGYNPAFTQTMYRIGDSVTNPITPMMAYFAILVGLAKKYDKDAGIGSLMSALLPYSIGFFIFWTLFLIAWVLIGLPIGPGFGMYL